MEGFNVWVAPAVVLRESDLQKLSRGFSSATLVGVEESSVSSSTGCDEIQMLKDVLVVTIYIDDHLFVKHYWLRDSSIAFWILQLKWSLGKSDMSKSWTVYQTNFPIYTLSFVADGTIIYPTQSLKPEIWGPSQTLLSPLYPPYSISHYVNSNP